MDVFDEKTEWKTEGIRLLKAMGFKTAAMALKEDSFDIDDPHLMAEEKLAVVLGTEGDGLASETIADCDYTVCIPMAHGVDSLNVAAASAVAFWQLGNIKKMCRTGRTYSFIRCEILSGISMEIKNAGAIIFLKNSGKSKTDKNQRISEKEEESQMKKFLEEFKAFALRGNVMDMAIGVIMAFILFCLLKAVNKITSIGAKRGRACTNYEGMSVLQVRSTSRLQDAHTVLQF